MSDFVVYEDSPLAEYLNSIDSGESLIKPAPLSLGSHPGDMKPKVPFVTQLSEVFQRHWRQSLFHDTFSASLPIMEETAFEEKFKYLIVTSSLMNDTLSVHPKQKQRQSSTSPHPFHATTAHTRSARIGTVVTISGLLVALGVERLLLSQENVYTLYQQEGITGLILNGVTSTLTTALAGGVSLYFVYRHLRRSSIRKMYQCALTQLQDILQQSQIFDSKVHRALLTIQEIELVSRGYRLSTPLSPISRIEQTSKSKRCERLRLLLSSLLRRAFMIYEDVIIEMSDWVNQQSLSRLFDMYNIHSVASLSAAATTSINDTNGSDDELTLDYLKNVAHLMHLKRRECILQFLALTVMTGDHDSNREDYEAGWRDINTVLAKLVDTMKGFVTDVTNAMEFEFSKSAHLDGDNKSQIAVSTSTESRHFIHRLSTLDQFLRTMEARVHLCNEELQQRQRLVSKTTNVTTDNDHHIELDQQQKILEKEYMAMEKDIHQLVVEWEAGRTALDLLLAPKSPALDTIDTDQQLASPPVQSPETPTPTHQEGDQPSFVVTSDESSELFDLPLPSKASVYESVAEVLESASPVSRQPKKSRLERIAEMKQKREQDAQVKSTKMDSQNMVHELKNVLDRRVLEFDLADDA